MALARVNTDLVMGAWLPTLPGINSGMVGAQVPERAEANAALATSGFVSWMGVGGTPNAYVPERNPVLQVKCYGFPTASASRKPQWALANELAENVVNAVTGPNQLQYFGQLLSFNPVGAYSHAYVQSAYPLGEPRRLYGDRASWAVYWFDLQIHWVDTLT